MRLPSLWTALLTALLASACAHRPELPPESERETLLLREREFLAALAARDPERTSAFFADDAMLHVANLPAVRGRSAIRQFYGNVFRFLSESSSTPELQRVAVGADMGYTAGRVRNVFERQQAPAEFTGKYLLVWERRGGEWQIVAYALSSDRAEASP